jgi:CRISPR-associated protein Csx10
MNGFTYTLILHEPVLANSLAGDTNSARSLPFVPGGLIRGALVSLYQGEKKAGDKDFQRLFLKGRTCFLHAYPESNGSRTLPAPLAWKTHKDDNARGVENFAHSVKPDIDLEKAPFKFYTLDGTTIYRVKEQWQVNVHTQRDAVFGRAKGPGQGAVFRYEALPAGLRLKGIVLTDTKEDAEALKGLIADGIILGKARTAGYGRAQIIPGEDLASDWREDSSASLPSATVHGFTVTFLSDAILRDENGQVTPDPIPALKAKLNLTDLEATRTFRSTELVGGFNRQWRMALPQSAALGAGSVFVMETKSGVSGEALSKLEQFSLGERTAEGFGRLAVSTQQTEHFVLDEAELTFEEPERQKLLPGEEPVARLMLKRLMRRELDQRMLSAVIEAMQAYAGGVKNSQLSRWRVNLRSAIARPEKGLEKIREFYKKEHTRNSPSWQKMTRARLKIGERSPRLSEWMEDLLETPAGVWDVLGYSETKPPSRRIAEMSFDASRDLEAEYSLRMIDAVLAALAKKNVEGGKNA